jgi:prolyl-tRNA synthetase
MVEVIPISSKDAPVREAAERLYGELRAAGVECLLDDRDERPGVKFKDADLIGIPFRLAIGKKGVAEGVVELKRRNGTEVRKLKIDEAVKIVVAEIQAERK